jgi:hypothetical protein
MSSASSVIGVSQFSSIVVGDSAETETMSGVAGGGSTDGEVNAPIGRYGNADPAGAVDPPMNANVATAYSASS